MNNSYIVSLNVDGQILCEGKGNNKEEAQADCLEKIREVLEFDVLREDGIRLPEHEAQKAPVVTPDGRVLVALVRCSHNSGNPYDWRYVAVPKWNCIIHPSGKFDPITEPKTIHFMDCNADYEFELPLRSYEFINGDWQSAEKIAYGY